MTTAKFFDANPTVLAEPVLFGLRGHRISTGGMPPGGVDPAAEGYWQEEFRSVRVLPGAVLDEVSGSVTFAHGEVTGINQAQAIPVLRAVITADGDDARRFEALLRDRDRVVDLMTLWQTAMYVVTELSGRPTGASGD